MLIKKNQRNRVVIPSFLTRFLSNRSLGNRLFKCFLVFSLLGIGAISCIYYGANLQTQGKTHYVKRWGLTLINKPFSIVKNYWNGLGASPTKMQLDIKFEHYQKLAFQRDLAMKYGRSYRVHPSNMGYVPARLTYEGASSKIKIRLKGGQAIHYGHDYLWSFKIKMGGKGRVQGMKAFSVQQAKNRGYLNEWLLHKLLQFNNLIHLNYDFVELIINGKNYGIYALEENMAKQLIERNGKKEGPILSYNSDIIWDESLGQAAQFFGGEIKLYNEDEIYTNETLAKNFETAKNLLELFRRQELPVSKVFDISKWTTYFALIDLTGYPHATSLKDVKFYYNPITSLIEPIGYDNSDFVRLDKLGLMGAGRGIRTDSTFVAKHYRYASDWYRYLFSDKTFYKAYIQKLEELSDKEWLDQFFEEVDSAFQEKLAILHTEHPWYNYDGVFEDPQILYYNQEYIKRFLNPQKVLQSHFYTQKEDKITLEIGNIIVLPIQVVGITIKDSIQIPIPDGPILQPYVGEVVNYEQIEIPFNTKDWADSLRNELLIQYRILGGKHVFQDRIFPWSNLDTTFAQTDFVRQPPNFTSFEMLDIDEEEKIIVVKQGNWIIEESLIIPKGYKVMAKEGSTIDLVKGAKILTYSPIIFRGTAENNIKLYSSDSTGQGLIVMTPNAQSILDYVHFEHLSNPKQGNWTLTSAISFYEAPVTIKNCLFASNIIGDDYLNIIRTSFTITNTTFYDTHSDAFDGDFCQGEITNSAFIKSGNDAIDISGSNLKVSEVLIDTVGDKALSAGEDSKMFVNNVQINQAELGVTSKDKSILLVSNTTITDTKIAYVAFQKKPEFGPGKIKAMASTINNAEIPYLIEEHSVMTLDGKVIGTSIEKAREILYGVKYGKESIR